MKDNQPSKQTVREILDEMDRHLVSYSYGVKMGFNPVELAEERINAHIVSVLEGLKEKSVNDMRVIMGNTEFRKNVSVFVIDAAIAKYKQEPKS